MKQFDDEAFQPAQQGELDAFCGVYAVSNFFFRHLNLSKDCEERWDLFRLFLNKLAGRGKFTVGRVSQDGFTDQQLQAAFNKVARSRELSVKATRLAVIAKKLRRSITSPWARGVNLIDGLVFTNA